MKYTNETTTISQRGRIAGKKEKKYTRFQLNPAQQLYFEPIQPHTLKSIIGMVPFISLHASHLSSSYLSRAFTTWKACPSNRQLRQLQSGPPRMPRPGNSPLLTSMETIASCLPAPSQGFSLLKLQRPLIRRSSTGDRSPTSLTTLATSLPRVILLTTPRRSSAQACWTRRGSFVMDFDSKF
jgi:hypothetical protein